MPSSSAQEGPRRLGDFEIIRELGRGGMGVVYEAGQRSLNRQVALKVLATGLGLTTKAIRRFQLEAEAAAKLHHTNIVPIYWTGEDQGTHYYAMEFVAGPSLDQVIRILVSDGRRSLPESWADLVPGVNDDGAPTDATQTSPAVFPPSDLAVRQQSSGSGASVSGSNAERAYYDAVADMFAGVADALDYAHVNLVIHRDIKPSNLLVSPNAQLRITDFGLARMLAQPGVTMTGEFVGTPVYMSPEQITAGRTPLDHRTDIYSLGVTLYELLTLQKPFQGASREQILGQIIHKEPVAPRRLVRLIPVDLETICLKAMEKDPDRRYERGKQMADDLRRFVNRYAISARRVGVVGRLVRWARRQPALASAVVAATLFAALALGFAWQSYYSNQQLMEGMRRRAMDEAFVAVMGGPISEAEEKIAEAERLGASTAQVRLLRGQLSLSQGEFEQAITHLKQAVNLLPESVAAQALLAQVYLRNNQWPTYQQLLSELGEATPRTAEDYLFKGVAESQWDPALALVSIDRAIELRNSVLARAIRGDVLSFHAQDVGDSAKAKLALDDARIARTMLPDHPWVLSMSLQTQTRAARILALAGDDRDSKAALAQAEMDAARLETFDNMPGPRAALRLYWYRLGQYDRLLEAPLAAGQNGLHLSLIYYQRGQLREALEHVDAYLKRREDNPIAQLSRAFIVAELEDGPRLARQAYEALSDQYHPGEFPHSIPILAQSIALLLGDEQQARNAALAIPDQESSYPPLKQERYRRLRQYLATAPHDESKLLGRPNMPRSDESEAQFMVGLMYLSGGNRPQAAKHFQLSIDTGVYFAYPTWCRCFLSRLEADPSWPPWISANGN